MEEGTIIREKYTFNKKVKSGGFKHRGIYKIYMSKKLFAIFITILIVLDNKKVYGQIEVNNSQNEKNNGAVTQNIDADSNAFVVDNNAYKILEKGGVMLWASNNENVVVKDHIYFNGTIFEVKYIYENAFENNSNIKNICIEKNILLFCDSYGNPIKDLANVFNNKRKLTDVDLGKIECTLGERCFFDCNELINLKISKSIKSIGGHTFERCISLNSIDLSEINKFDGESSFGFCRELNDVGQFNDELEELPARTFFKCGKLKINKLKNIRKLGDECFRSCRQLNEDAVINVEEIGERCFWDCNFSEVDLKKAKKICQNALGGMESLQKVRFGAPEIPFLAKDISMGSKVNEWIYPKDYINQEGYLLFLSKLELSKVKWYPNFDNLNYETTQGVRLNSLKPPKSFQYPNIIRPGYEIEGWYKEPECIHKVNMIADLGEIIDSDIVIKNPELYAKWREKEESSSNQEEKKNEEKKSKPSDLPEPQSEKEEDKQKNDKETTEEKNKPDEPKKEIDNANDKSKEPINIEEKTNNSEKDIENNENKGEKTTTAELSEGNDSNKSIIEKEKKESKEKSKHKSKKRIIRNKNNNFSKTPINRKRLKNDIKSISIINNSDEKEVEIKKCDASSLDYKMTEDFVESIFGKNSELEALNISYKEVANDNMEISKSGVLGITNDNECNGICLISNDYFEKNSIIEIRLKSNINLSKLYIYNKELCKYISADDKLEVQNNVIRIKSTTNKEYLITKFELNKEDIAVNGWNKINNDWYYINSDGVLIVNAIINGYKVGSDGKLI